METGPNQILIVDDDPLHRAFVSSLFQRAGYTTGEASTGEEALAIVRDEQPACVLLDVLLPVATGYEVCQELRDAYGEAFPIVFVTGERTEPADRVAGLLIGADDYVLKSFDSDELITRVRRLIARQEHFAQSSAGDDRFALTARERDVLALLADGLDQDAIARELVISPTTVASHLQRILKKLGVHSRAQAVALAHREGLVEMR